MRIASWNINSLRARMGRLLDVLDTRQIDAIALQEIKAKPEQLDLAELEARGYEVAAHGLNQWNGVAIVSRVGLEDVEIGLPDMPEYDGVAEARAITATVGGVRLTSLYIPNGREIDHAHYDYKLEFLDCLTEHGRSLLAKDPSAPIVFAGDFNVAPTDADVWDPSFFEGKTHVTPPERRRIRALEEAGFRDATRDWLDAPGTFTYWDYTSRRFQKKQGMRIDFLFSSPAVHEAATGAMIDTEERAQKGTSDHAPIILDVSL